MNPPPPWCDSGGHGGADGVHGCSDGAPGGHGGANGVHGRSDGAGLPTRAPGDPNLSHSSKPIDKQNVTRALALF
eukprot:849307-Prorocentrum_minimum.AAC.1